MLCLNMKSLLLLRVFVINIACKQNNVVTLKDTSKKNYSKYQMANFSQIKRNVFIKIKRSLALTFFFVHFSPILSLSKMKKGENKLSKQLKYQSASLSASITKKHNWHCVHKSKVINFINGYLLFTCKYSFSDGPHDR